MWNLPLAWLAALSWALSQAITHQKRIYSHSCLKDWLRNHNRAGSSGGVMQRQNQNQGQKSIFPRKQTPGAGTNGSTQHSRWEQEQGRITRPWLPPEMPLMLHWAHLGIPGVGTVLCQAFAGQWSCGGFENPRQPKCFFWDTVKAWRGNLYWWAIKEIPFVLLYGHGATHTSHWPSGPGPGYGPASVNLALDFQLEKALGTEGAKFLSKQNSSSACISFGITEDF